MSPCLLLAWPGFALLSVPTLLLPVQLCDPAPRSLILSTHLVRVVRPSWGFSGQERAPALSKQDSSAHRALSGCWGVPAPGSLQHRGSWCGSICRMGKKEQKDRSAAKDNQDSDGSQVPMSSQLWWPSCRKQ